MTEKPVGVPFVDLARGHRELSHELEAAYQRVLRTSAFCLGDELEQFEREFADYCGARCCVGVASGTAALTIMLQAAGIGPGDEVIVPAHTFIATALAVIHAGAKPVCVDVSPANALIDPDAVAAAIGPATAAILAVHLYGQACPMEPLRELAARHGLVLLEDAAQAHGASYRGVRAGALGAAAAFSFYPSKNLGALGDGGAICTDDELIAERSRQLRDLGRGSSRTHSVVGYNERLDGLQAAFLRAKLGRLDAWNDERRALAQAYRERLAMVELTEEAEDSPSVYHLFAIRVAGRDGLAASLATEEIESSVHYPASLPEQPALRKLTLARTPVAEDWAARELSLPLFPGMRIGEVEQVASAVNRWVDRNLSPAAGLRLGAKRRSA